MNIKKILKYLASAALAALLLWVSFREVEWNDFLVVLKQCNWAFVILSMAAGSSAFWLRALRWRRLLLPIDDSISRITAFNGVNIGNISNFVFPRIGEFIRCGVITRRSAEVYATTSDGHVEKIQAPNDKMQMIELTKWMCTGKDYSFDGRNYRELTN